MATRDGITRRKLVQTGGALAAALAASPLAAGPRGQAGPNSRLGVGFIGCGGRSGAHMQTLHWLKEQAKEPIELVAFCDVYGPRLRRAAEAYGSKRVYADYRKLLADPAVD